MCEVRSTDLFEAYAEILHVFVRVHVSSCTYVSIRISTLKTKTYDKDELDHMSTLCLSKGSRKKPCYLQRNEYCSMCKQEFFSCLSAPSWTAFFPRIVILLPNKLMLKNKLSRLIYSVTLLFAGARHPIFSQVSCFGIQAGKIIGVSFDSRYAHGGVGRIMHVTDLH